MNTFSKRTEIEYEIDPSLIDFNPSVPMTEFFLFGFSIQLNMSSILLMLFPRIFRFGFDRLTYRFLLGGGIFRVADPLRCRTFQSVPLENLTHWNFYTGSQFVVSIFCLLVALYFFVCIRYSDVVI